MAESHSAAFKVHPERQTFPQSHSVCAMAVTMDIKKSKAVQEILEKYKARPDAQLIPDEVGWSQHNRPVNIQYVHALMHRVAKDGFDPSRPHKGVVIHLSSSEAVDQLVEAQQTGRYQTPQTDADILLSWRPFRPIIKS